MSNKESKVFLDKVQIHKQAIYTQVTDQRISVRALQLQLDWLSLLDGHHVYSPSAAHSPSLAAAQSAGLRLQQGTTFMYKNEMTITGANVLLLLRDVPISFSPLISTAIPKPCVSARTRRDLKPMH